ncbi:MAG: hypothetical protein KGJ13_07955, partial [Patescibacteria group bacterium]|nr:hypothetical protein [Patescibacteria group bacterium]
EFLSQTGTGSVSATPAWSTFITNYGRSSDFFAGGAGSSSWTGSYAVLIGNIAGGTSPGDDQNTFVGYGAGNGAVSRSTETGGYNVCVGTFAGLSLTSGRLNVYVGRSSTGAATDTGCVAIGESSSAGGNYTIAIGSNCAIPSTSTNVLGVGGNDVAGHGITDGYFGDGPLQVSGSTPDNFTLHATGGQGTNITGATLGLAGGVATGNAASGPIVFKSAKATSSGTTAQTLATIHTFDTGGEILSEQAATVATNATTLSGQAEFYEIPSNAGTAVAVTGPAGTTGRIILIENKDATANTTGLVVPATQARWFVYDGSSWIPIE